MFKNAAGQRVGLYAWDSANSVPKTGDAANITAYLSKDTGTVGTASGTVTELDGTLAKGYYYYEPTQEESNCDLFASFPLSSTADVHIEPRDIYTMPNYFTSLGIGTNGTVEANIKYVNDGEIDGVGSAGDPWGPKA